MTGKASTVRMVKLTNLETIDDGKVKEEVTHQLSWDSPGSE